MDEKDRASQVAVERIYLTKAWKMDTLTWAVTSWPTTTYAVALILPSASLNCVFPEMHMMKSLISCLLSHRGRGKARTRSTAASARTQGLSVLMRSMILRVTFLGTKIGVVGSPPVPKAGYKQGRGAHEERKM